MGCAGSKVQNEEGINRCRRRKRVVKHAVKYRNQYAIAHTEYLDALRTLGTAFRQFTDGEFREQLNLSSSGSSSSTTSTPPVPATPTTPAAEEEIVQRVSLPPMALKKKPSTPLTVVVSPPRSPKTKSRSKEEDDAYQRYLENDAPPEGLYSYITQPAQLGRSSSPPSYSSVMSSSSPAAAKAAAAAAAAASSSSYSSSSFSSHPYAASSEPPSWDFFGIFQPIPMTYFNQNDLGEVAEEDEEDLKQVLEEEGIPALETDSPPHHHHHKEEESDAEVEHELKPEKNEKQKEVIVEEGDSKDVASTSGTADEKVVEEEVVVKAEAKSAPPPLLKEEPPAPPKKDLEVWDVLRVIEEQFMKASKSGLDVARMLEARKHSDSRGLSGSARILRAVSRTQWSPRTPLSFSEDSSSEDFAATKGGGHASSLDKLYAWEKRLYIEVKDNDALATEFEKKGKQLKKLDAKGASHELIDKTRATIKQLETQLHVSMQAMKATSKSIQKLTDEEMYPQLLELLEASMIMWRNMSDFHQRQKDAAARMKPAGSPPLEATSNSHRQATVQLEAALNEWHRSLDSVMNKQREYMRDITSWLRLSIFTPDRKPEKRPPVLNLCQAWTESLDRIQDKELVGAIKVFSEAIHNIVRQQEEEARIQRKAEVSAKELSKKALSLNNLEKRLVANAEATEEAKNSLKEKKEALEEFRKRVEQERESFTRGMQITRKMTLEILDTGLPRLFNSLAVFASSCLQNYRDLQHKSRTGELDKDQN